MNEQLIVKNFGPIKDATVDFKKVTVFIGPTGGGKSTLAKLAAVFRDSSFYRRGSRGAQMLINGYGLEHFASDKTNLDWHVGEGGAHLSGSSNWQIKTPSSVGENILQLKKRIEEAQELINNLIKHDDVNKVNNALNKLNIDSESFDRTVESYLSNTANSKPHYLPAERAILSILGHSWPTLLQSPGTLPLIISFFAQGYIEARKNIKKLYLPAVNFTYIYNNEQDYIQDHRKNRLLLSESASGLQSITPMMVLLEHLPGENERAQSFIIEEPELNLYPTAQ